jgi:hypothetical protein
VEKCGTAREATDDNIIRRTRLEPWKTKATDTHSEYVIFIAFTATMVRRTRLNITLQVHFLYYTTFFTHIDFLSHFETCVSLSTVEQISTR